MPSYKYLQNQLLLFRFYKSGYVSGWKRRMMKSAPKTNRASKAIMKGMIKVLERPLKEFKETLVGGWLTLTLAVAVSETTSKAALSKQVKVGEPSILQAVQVATLTVSVVILAV